MAMRSVNILLHMSQPNIDGFCFNMGHFKGHKGHFKGQDRKTRKARTPEALVLTKTLNEKPESLAQTVLTIVLTIWQRYGDLIITSYIDWSPRCLRFPKKGLIYNGIVRPCLQCFWCPRCMWPKLSTFWRTVLPVSRPFSWCFLHFLG